MAQIATTWILAKPGVSAPIIGTTSLKNLEDILGEYSALCRTHVGNADWGDALQVRSM